MNTVGYNAGDTIISEGEAGDSAFLIVDGTVEVSIGEGSKAKVLAELGAGDVFGEMSLLEPGPRSATVTARSNTKCVCTSYDEFMSSFQQDPEQAVEFMKTMVRRLRQMNELMATMDPKRRGFRDVIRDWQAAAALNTDIELTDEEREENWLRMQAQMPFY